ncbi:hypothetical protein HRE53_01650 [Acaryochloris sp. 'Moss Beach']|uniref:hypothetical protein n=1 Tax=Acaryochloris sp. 'Moss Beach' TaxID=2740837 RepID=UPI001F45A533|nr:hypothetical protein [Acaryochloris sp. 'Moss Beach']UJB69905.1 hypothetical protein HRE53_01650 [Acaryochloris sp. 'Moss Beach']
MGISLSGDKQFVVYQPELTSNEEFTEWVKVSFKTTYGLASLALSSKRIITKGYYVNE